MVLTTEYKRHSCRGICNVVGSTTSPIDFIDISTIVTAACEDVYLWDLRRNAKVIGCRAFAYSNLQFSFSFRLTQLWVKKTQSATFESLLLSS